MLNLIKMNLYRLIHTESMYVLIAISLCFSLINVFALGIQSEETNKSPVESFAEGWEAAEQEANAGNEETKVIVDIGIYFDPSVNPDGTITYYIEYLIEDFSCGVILIFLSIAAALFMNGENKFGFVKNIVSNNVNRSTVYMAKVITLAIYTFAMTVIYSIATYINLLIYFKGKVKFGFEILPDAAVILALLFLLMLAFNSGIEMVTTVTKSNILGIILGILSALGIPQMIYFVINKLADVDLSKYTVCTNFNELRLSADNETLMRAFGVGFVCIIAYNVIGCIWVTKKDVV